MTLRGILFPALGLVLGLASLAAAARADCTYSYQCTNYIEGECSEPAMITNCTPSAPPAPYGAIAYGKDSGAFGFAYNQDSASTAERVALSKCAQHGGDCEIAVRLAHNCGAVAAGDGGTVASGTGSTRNEAEAAAMSACRSRAGKSCAIQAWTCSP